MENNSFGNIRSMIFILVCSSQFNLIVYQMSIKLNSLQLVKLLTRVPTVSNCITFRLSLFKKLSLLVGCIISLICSIFIAASLRAKYSGLRHIQPKILPKVAVARCVYFNKGLEKLYIVMITFGQIQLWGKNRPTAIVRYHILSSFVYFGFDFASSRKTF